LAVGPQKCYQRIRWLLELAFLMRQEMTKTDEIEALELAALLCSRVCHDVISPVGA